MGRAEDCLGQHPIDLRLHCRGICKDAEMMGLAEDWLGQHHIDLRIHCQ